MSGAVVPFAFEDRLFRAVTIGDAWWFIAGDVAKILGYREARDLTRTLDEDEKAVTGGPHTVRRGAAQNGPETGEGVHIVDPLGTGQEISIISEPGLWRALANRRSVRTLKPEVRALIERFQRWLFHDLLPTLRRTGRYEMPGAAPIAAAEDAAGLSMREREHQLDRVRIAERLFGPRAGRAMWKLVGQPDLADPATLGEAAAAQVAPEPDAPLDRAEVAERVRCYLERAGAPRLPSPSGGNAGEASFRLPGGDFVLTPPAWAAAVAPLSPKAAADALHAAGLMVRNGSGERTKSHKVDGRTVRFFHVRAALLA